MVWFRGTVCDNRSMKQANLGLSTEELNHRQTWLQQQADDLMEDLQLLDLARLAGQPKVVGSYDLGLMVWPDLDIEIHTTGVPDLRPALEIVNHLMLDAGVTKVSIADTRQETNPEAPRGIYLGPDIVRGELAWQVDIWLINHAEAAARHHQMDGFRGKLNDATRRRILQIKQVAAASDKYHRGVSSVDIYVAVLDRGVENLAGFEAYLQETGRSL
jgi:hypothetical protein